MTFKLLAGLIARGIKQASHTPQGEAVIQAVLGRILSKGGGKEEQVAQHLVYMARDRARRIEQFRAILETVAQDKPDLVADPYLGVSLAGLIADAEAERERMIELAAQLTGQPLPAPVAE